MVGKYLIDLHVEKEVNSNDEHLVTIRGSYPACVRALRYIFHSLENSHPDSKYMMYVRFPFALAQLGAVIGKGGESISEIRSKCSVSVKVPNTNTSQNRDDNAEIYAPDRIMHIMGASDNVVTAILMAFDKLLDLPNSNRFRGNISQAQIDSEQIVQSPGLVDHRAKESVRKLSKDMHQQELQSPAKRQKKSCDPFELPASAAVSVNVTQQQASLLIGHKGSTIHLIRELSSARVTIETCDGENDRREFVVMGTVKQCELALNLLQQCTRFV